jgi:probable F420-dependent oxidoreductase
MKLGLFTPLEVPLCTPAFLRALGGAAEESRVNRIWIADPHIVWFDSYSSRHPYMPEGSWPSRREELDSFALLAFLAAVTKTPRLATAVCIVPQQNPLYTAKAVTSIDHLSDGRFDFGVGLGVSSEEYAATGVPWQRRGERCSAYLETMVEMWKGPTSGFETEFFRIPSCRQDPSPLQVPHPPIFVAGESEAALKRVAKLGQGWLAVDLTPHQVRERIRKLRSLLATLGRSITEIQVAIILNEPNLTSDLVKSYAEAGVDELVPRVVFSSEDHITEKLDPILETVLDCP